MAMSGLEILISIFWFLLLFCRWPDRIIDGMTGSMTAVFSMKSSSSESVAAGKTLNKESFSLRRLKRDFSASEG